VLDEFPWITVISDEVYDYLTFDSHKHVHFATIKNNWQRTVSIFSGGKLFSCTGWKVGWAIAPQELINLGGIINNTVTYSQNTPAQVAFAHGLNDASSPDYNEHTGDSYTEDTRKYFQSTRDYMVNELAKVDLPWTLIPSEGGYFILADISKCKSVIPSKYLTTHDYEASDDAHPVNKYELYLPGEPQGRIPLDQAFCRWMAVEK